MFLKIPKTKIKNLKILKFRLFMGIYLKMDWVTKYLLLRLQGVFSFLGF